MPTRSTFVIDFSFTYGATDTDNFCEYRVTRKGPAARNFPVVTYRLKRLAWEHFELAGIGGPGEDDLPLENYHSDGWPLVQARRAVEREERRIGHFIDLLEPKAAA